LFGTSPTISPTVWTKSCCYSLISLQTLSVVGVSSLKFIHYKLQAFVRSSQTM